MKNSVYKFSIAILGLITMLTLFGCTIQEPSVNAEGYGGSDSVTDSVRAALTNVSKALGWIRSQSNLGYVCTWDETANASAEPFVRQHLKPLTTAQRTFVRDLVLNAEFQETMINQANQTPFIVTDQPLVVNGTEVDAATNLSTEGSIVFSRSRIINFTPFRLVALVSHELGHKITHSSFSGHIEDDPAFGPFPSGTRFLDTMGACIGEYLRINRVPSSLLSN